MVSSVDLINSNLRKENDGVKVAMNNLASELNANFLNNLCTNPVYFQEKKKICNVNFSRSGLAEDKVDFSEKQIKKYFLSLMNKQLILLRRNLQILLMHVFLNRDKKKKVVS